MTPRSRRRFGVRIALAMFMSLAALARTGQPPFPAGMHALADLSGVHCDTSVQAPLDEVVADARVVALGEVSHGSGTIQDARACLTRYLVEEHGIGIVALEQGLPMVEALVGAEEPRALFAAAPGLFATEETLAFVEWARARGDVTVTGFDVWTNRATIENVLAFLDEHDPAYADEARTAYDGLLHRDVGAPPTTRDYGRWRTAAEAVLDHLAARRERYAETADERRVDRVVQEARLLTQDLALRESAVGGGNVRDPHLARNVRWLLDRHPDEKLVLWAHNTHVAKDHGTHPGAPPVMGELLAEHLGDDYVAVAFTFGTGSFRALVRPDDGIGPSRPRTIDTDPPMEGTLEALLLEHGWGDVLLDLAALDEPLREELLGQPRAMRAIGGNASDPTYDFHDLDETFDAAVFVERSAATTPVPEAE